MKGIINYKWGKAMDKTKALDEIWRQRTFQHWTYNKENFTLTHREGCYEIDLETCIDSAEMLDWIFQLLHKAWMTDEAMAELLLLFDELLEPQANLCSWGRDCGPVNPKEIILERENLRWSKRER